MRFRYREVIIQLSQTAQTAFLLIFYVSLSMLSLSLPFISVSFQLFYRAVSLMFAISYFYICLVFRIIYTTIFCSSFSLRIVYKLLVHNKEQRFNFIMQLIEYQEYPTLLLYLTLTVLSFTRVSNR